MSDQAAEDSGPERAEDLFAVRLNPAWDRKRGVAGDAYGEYLPAARLAEVTAAAAVIRDGINAVRNQGYVSQQGFWLWGNATYPTSGASEDWAFTREFPAGDLGTVRAVDADRPAA